MLFVCLLLFFFFFFFFFAFFFLSDKRAFITKARLFKYIKNFTSKTEKSQIKNSDIFHTSAQNIDCGYTIEPPRRGGSNEYK